MVIMTGATFEMVRRQTSKYVLLLTFSVSAPSTPQRRMTTSTQTM